VCKGLSDVNAVEVFHHAIPGHGHLTVIVQEVADLGIKFFKSARNGEIIDHSHKEDELIIQSAVIQTRFMCGVLELEHHKDIMATNCPEVWVFRMALEVLVDRNNHIGGGGGRDTCLPTNLRTHDCIACNRSDGVFSFSEYIGGIDMPYVHA
jgi:hypothetical protein